jgi:hypothetical protein
VFVTSRRQQIRVRRVATLLSPAGRKQRWPNASGKLVCKWSAANTLAWVREVLYTCAQCRVCSVHYLCENVYMSVVNKHEHVSVTSEQKKGHLNRIRDVGVRTALRQEIQARVSMMIVCCPSISEWRIEYIRMWSFVTVSRLGVPEQGRKKRLHPPFPWSRGSYKVKK